MSNIVNIPLRRFILKIAHRNILSASSHLSSEQSAVISRCPPHPKKTKGVREKGISSYWMYFLFKPVKTTLILTLLRKVTFNYFMACVCPARVNHLDLAWYQLVVLSHHWLWFQMSILKYFEKKRKIPEDEGQVTKERLLLWWCGPSRSDVLYYPAFTALTFRGVEITKCLWQALYLNVEITFSTTESAKITGSSWDGEWRRESWRRAGRYSVQRRRRGLN